MPRAACHAPPRRGARRSDRRRDRRTRPAQAVREGRGGTRCQLRRARRHDDGAARRQRRRQDDDAVDAARRAAADGGIDPRARLRHAARPLSRAAADELHVAVRRPAEAPDGAREPARVRRSLRRARAVDAHRRAGGRARPRRLAEASLRQLSAGQRTRVSLAKALLEPSPTCCCSTSPPPRSIPTSATGCAPTSRTTSERAAARCCSRRTT